MLQDLKDQEILKMEEKEALTLKKSTISSLLKSDMNQSLAMARVAIGRVVAVVAIIITSRLPLLVKFSQAVAEVEAHPQAAEVEITRIKVIKEAATTESDICMHNQNIQVQHSFTKFKAAHDIVSLVTFLDIPVSSNDSV